MADAVDYDGLELIDMRLEIDVDTLLDYLRANSDFPDGPASVSCDDTFCLRAVLNCCTRRIAELGSSLARLRRHRCDEIALGSSRQQQKS